MDKMKEKEIKIPENIIREILLRLPAISLFRFRCVCKDWYQIIVDSDFSVSHIQKSISALMIDFGIDKVGSYNLEERTKKARDLADSFRKQHKFKIDREDYASLQYSFLPDYHEDEEDTEDPWMD
ncbi:hypothetical protein Ddye_004297 [Dipteronia dyeriana]|uniref:F-box domain-containing protein n=1 Tax=Dipteronia dyeriana TaxID=168575 RepID=A0AAD9XVK8_9ROSI|nr:hypothetical protein Ddye_004297 [Dipteronia dyeriana]